MDMSTCEICGMFVTRTAENGTGHVHVHSIFLDNFGDCLILPNILMLGVLFHLFNVFIAVTVQHFLSFFVQNILTFLHIP